MTFQWTGDQRGLTLRLYNRLAHILANGPNWVFPFSLLVVVGTWQRVGSEVRLLPTPTEVAHSLLLGISNGLFVQHGWATLSSVLLGFGLGVVIGSILAALIVRFKVVESALMPYILALQCTPKVMVAPLFSIWFGFGLFPRVAVVSLVAMFPVLVSTIAGLRAIDRNQLLLFRAFRASSLEILLRLRIPSALPYFFSGLRISIVFSLLGAIVAEFVATDAGLGRLLIQYDLNLDVASQFAVLLVLVLIAATLYWSLSALQRAIVYWT